MADSSMSGFAAAKARLSEMSKFICKPISGMSLVYCASVSGRATNSSGLRSAATPQSAWITAAAIISTAPMT